MRLRQLCAFWLVAAVLSAATVFGAADIKRGPQPTPRASLTPRVGDFDMMLERRVVRVLAPPSRTLYFNDKGRERGITAELVRDFEEFLNQKYRRKLHNRPITVFLIPTAREGLISDLLAGKGDIAAGNLTVTDERLREVDFIAPPDLKEVSELVLTSKRRGAMASVDELSGQTVHVRASSSYHQSLQTLAARFQREGKPPVKLVPVPDMVEDEDLMEMLDAGVIDVIVVDDWKAKMWAKILPNLIVNEGVAVRTGAHVGWAYRKNSPLLLAELEEFYYKYEKQRGTIPYRFAQYNKQVKRLQDPTGRNDWKRFEETVALFEKYGAQYGFDPIMLAAQGFQESKLDQTVRSPVGAIGIMQVMPETGASLKVGDITVTEPNIHAGAKYMNTLMTKYFQDAHFDELNRTLFAFASYNAGPNRIARLRKLAPERGFNPDVWFDNVEVIVSEKVGRETTTYVRNIVKYYLSYRLTIQMNEEQRKAREALTPAGG
ncbi:MAG TPA: transporter substrate-binding domain-containing protein [Candidatus Krumholzibacteria bacterium]|nr:transporter substrate-binding domain-containing protein [Candidatus Krumholzibacteria bacterium]